MKYSSHPLGKHLAILEPAAKRLQPLSQTQSKLRSLTTHVDLELGQMDKILAMGIFFQLERHQGPELDSEWNVGSVTEI